MNGVSRKSRISSWTVALGAAMYAHLLETAKNCPAISPLARQAETEQPAAETGRTG